MCYLEAVERWGAIMRKGAFATIAAMAITGCSSNSPSETYTLYRNSPYSVTRVHWATFDANEGNGDRGYNRDNCEMDARLLNANLTEHRRINNETGLAGVGFWCEPGKYSEKGSIPGHFDAEYPTDVQVAPSEHADQ